MFSLLTNFLKVLRPRGDDDFVDRLNYYTTPCILITCSVIVSAKQYVAKPIQCWIPPQFSRSMEEYIESYCWIQNTYWLPMHEHIPDDLQMREDRQIGYYQWVPFILVMEALMFVTPCLVWRLCSWQSGLNIQILIALANEIQGSPVEDRQKIVGCLTQNIQNVLDLQRWLGRTSATCRLQFLRHTRYCGCYITAVHLIVKFLYAANVSGQLFLLNSFLKSENFELYGLEVLTDLARGREWRQSGHFPRVTLCDFEVRYVGNLNRYTVQCALLVNIFNEKVFVFVWCWFLVLSTITALSFTFWLFNSTLSQQRASFVRKYLHIASAQEASRDLYCLPVHAFDRFADDYLKADGALILRIVANHAGDVAVVDIIGRLWKHYRDKHLRAVDSVDSLRVQQISATVDDDSVLVSTKDYASPLLLQRNA